MSAWIHLALHNHPILGGRSKWHCVIVVITLLCVVSMATLMGQGKKACYDMMHEILTDTINNAVKDGVTSKCKLTAPCLLWCSLHQSWDAKDLHRRVKKESVLHVTRKFHKGVRLHNFTFDYADIGTCTHYYLYNLYVVLCRKENILFTKHACKRVKNGLSLIWWL